MNRSKLFHLFLFGATLCVANVNGMSPEMHDMAKRLVAEQHFEHSVSVLNSNAHFLDSLEINLEEPRSPISLEEFQRNYVNYDMEIPSILKNTQILVFTVDMFSWTPTEIILQSSDGLKLLPSDSRLYSGDENFSADSLVSVINLMLSRENARTYSLNEVRELAVLMFTMIDDSFGKGFPRVLRSWIDIMDPPLNDFYSFYNRDHPGYRDFRNEYDREMKALRENLGDELMRRIVHPVAAEENGVITVDLFTRTRKGNVHFHKFSFVDNQFSIAKQEFIGTFDVMP